MPDAEQKSFEPSEGDRMVARRAVIVTPKQAYFDWLLSMGDEGRDAEEMEREPDRWPRVLLIPAFLDGDDSRLFFAEHVREVLEDILDVALDRPMWPKKRDLEKFLEWFDVVHADTIHDHGHGKFYVETGDEFIGDDYHAWAKDFLMRRPPPPSIVKVRIDDYLDTPETRSRLDSIVLLARYFTWCNAIYKAHVNTGVGTLTFQPDPEIELLDDANEHHIATTLHWLASLCAVIDGWETLGLEDTDVARCLATGGDVASPESHRNRLDRARKAVTAFQNDPAAVDEIRGFSQGETIEWAGQLDSAFLRYFRGFLNEDGPAMKWVYRSS